MPAQNTLKTQAATIVRPEQLVEEHYATALKYNQLQELAKQPEYLRTSGPQGQIEPFTLVQDPAAWYAADWKDPNDFIYTLSEQDIKELDNALENVAKKGLDIQDIKQEDFPLQTLGPKLVSFREQLRVGRGFQIIKGIPIDKYTRKETITVYFAFGTYWGNPASQNKMGHYLGHVKNIAASEDLDDPNTRVYRTSLAQPFHHDNCDMVGLFCLKNAQEGGQSSWASSVSVHNELLKLGRADLVEELTQDFYMSRKGEIPDGKKHYYKIPVFNYYKGYLSTAYGATFYEVAQQFEDVPKFTEKRKEAIRWFNSLAQSDRLRMDYILQPGDIQLLNNHQMLHNRQSFKDHQDIDQRRHLLRLWISPTNERPLPEPYDEHFGGLQAGKRGGIVVEGVKYNRVPLEAE